MRQDRECWWCGKPENIEGIQMHHVFKRSTHPEHIDSEENLMPLCRTHHDLTEQSDKFYRKLQTLWTMKTSWTPGPSLKP